MLSNPFRDDSFLHSIAQRKYAQLTLFLLEELNQLIDLNLITKQQLNKLFNALKYQSTALMLICRMGDDSIFVKFFSVLINAYGQDLIDQHILKDLLTKTEGLSFNPLHMLLNNASVHSIDHFLTIIIICYHYKVLSSQDYSLLLSAATKDGYSTLHDAIKTNNPVIVGKILRLNLSAVELGIASPDTLYHLLTSRCKGGFNPLQKIYISKNYEHQMVNHQIRFQLKIFWHVYMLEHDN